MDWQACKKNGLVKEVTEDKSKIIALRKITKQKEQAALFLPSEHYYAAITLLYDALRSELECLALEEGYKIYNHECYTCFLKEILKQSYLGDLFDKERKLRNGINYYGKELTQEESKKIIKEIKELLEKIRNVKEKSNTATKK